MSLEYYEIFHLDRKPTASSIVENKSRKVQKKLSTAFFTEKRLRILVQESQNAAKFSFFETMSVINGPEDRILFKTDEI